MDSTCGKKGWYPISILPAHPHPLHSQANKALLEDPALDHEYLSITGLPEFVSAAAKLILGPQSKAIAEGRVARFVVTSVRPCHVGADMVSVSRLSAEPGRITWAPFSSANSTDGHPKSKFI